MNWDHHSWGEAASSPHNFKQLWGCCEFWKPQKDLGWKGNLHISDTAKTEQRTSFVVRSMNKEWQKGAAEVNQNLLSPFVTSVPVLFRK